MLSHSKRSILLCDSDKINQTYTGILFGFESIDTLITDKDPGPERTEFFSAHRVEPIFSGI